MQLAIVPDPRSDRQEGVDFILRAPSAWIRVGDLVVYLRRQDLSRPSADMLRVSVYPIDKAGENSLAEFTVPIPPKVELMQ